MSKKKKESKRKESRLALKQLRKQLALVGFNIFNVAKNKAKRGSAFVAWSKYGSCKIYLVQLNASHIIRVRPFCDTYLTPKVKNAIASTKRVSKASIQAGVKIRPLQKDLRPEHWLTPSCRDELQILTGIVL